MKPNIAKLREIGVRAHDEWEKGTFTEAKFLAALKEAEKFTGCKDELLEFLYKYAKTEWAFEPFLAPEEEAERDL